MHAGDSRGFDVWSFMREASRLKLPWQDIAVSVVDVGAMDEVTIAVALQACSRFSTNNGRTQRFLDSMCFHRYILLLNEDDDFESTPNTPKVPPQNLSQVLSGTLNAHVKLMKSVGEQISR